MSKIKDLEILKQYLNEDELKSIAKEAAYDLFKNSIGPDNPNRKDNIEWYAKQGALLAMKESMTDLDLSELQSTFNTKVNSVIKKIDYYNISDDFNKMLQTALIKHKENVENKVNELIAAKINNDSDMNSIYNKCNESVADAFSDILYNAVELHFKKKD